MKTSQIDRAILSLKADRAVLDLAIAKLEAQRGERTPARPRPPKSPRLLGTLAGSSGVAS